MSAPIIREDPALVDSDYPWSAYRDYLAQEKDDAAAADVLAAWVDVDPTARCLRVMRICGEWSVVAMELGAVLGRGYGRCLDAATIDVVRDIARRLALGVSGGAEVSR
jgi:hypothetical protein